MIMTSNEEWNPRTKIAGLKRMAISAGGTFGGEARNKSSRGDWGVRYFVMEHVFEQWFILLAEQRVSSLVGTHFRVWWLVASRSEAQAPTTWERLCRGWLLVEEWMNDPMLVYLKLYVRFMWPSWNRGRWSEERAGETTNFLHPNGFCIELKFGSTDNPHCPRVSGTWLGTGLQCQGF